MKRKYTIRSTDDLREHLEKVGPVLGELSIKEERSDENEKRRIEDLMKNNDFLESLKETKQFVQDNKVDRITELSVKLIEKLEKIATKYRLELGEVTPLWDFIKYGQVLPSTWDYVDVCIINHDWENLLKWSKDFDQKRFFERKRNDPNIYPVSISISAEASQGSIIKFIKDNWPVIKKAQNFIEPQTKKRRQRPQENRDQFIWENRDLPHRVIAREVRKQFDNNIHDKDIAVILKRLRKRTM